MIVLRLGVEPTDVELDQRNRVKLTVSATNAGMEMVDPELIRAELRVNGEPSMAFAEAIAHGLPVVATRGGALAETVPDGVGLLVPTDDAAALAAALRRLIEDRDERQKFAVASRKAALRLPTWEESGKLFAQIIEATA